LGAVRARLLFVAIKTPEQLDLLPKQESTGDRTILGKISKRGNKYLRTLFVQAAHVVLVRRPRAAMRGLWPWIEQASKRLHRNMHWGVGSPWIRFRLSGSLM
jgi:transposase